jgi:DNA-directed RNA polymerase specialized sigma24 family protein
MKMSDEDQAASLLDSDVYLMLRKRLVKYFEWRQVRDPGELTDEVFERLVKQLRNGVRLAPEAIVLYAWGIAKHVYSGYLRKEKTLAQVLCEVAANEQESRRISIQNIEPDAENLNLCLENCCTALSPEGSEVFFSYYPAAPELTQEEVFKLRVELAKALGLTHSGLRVKVYRIREKLKTCVMKCIEEASQGQHRM